MSSDMIIAWNEKHILKRLKLFPEPQRRFYVQRLMSRRGEDVKAKSEK